MVTGSGHHRDGRVRGRSGRRPDPLLGRDRGVARAAASRAARPATGGLLRNVAAGAARRSRRSTVGSVDDDVAAFVPTIQREQILVGRAERAPARDDRVRQVLAYRRAARTRRSRRAARPAAGARRTCRSSRARVRRALARERRLPRRRQDDPDGGCAGLVGRRRGTHAAGHALDRRRHGRYSMCASV